MPISSFYEKGKDVYKRIFNGSGSFISNIPIMFFEDKMETFELEFDLFFAESIEENAPASKEFEDPFRTYSFGPYPLQLFTSGNSMMTFMKPFYIKTVSRLRRSHQSGIKRNAPCLFRVLM